MRHWAEEAGSRYGSPALTAQDCTPRRCSREQCEQQRWGAGAVIPGTWGAPLPIAGRDRPGSGTCHSGPSRMPGRGPRCPPEHPLCTRHPPHTVGSVPKDGLQRGNVDSTNLLMYDIPPYAQRTCLCQCGREENIVLLFWLGYCIRVPQRNSASGVCVYAHIYHKENQIAYLYMHVELLMWLQTLASLQVCD